MGEDSDSGTKKSSSSGCGCGGCLTTIVIGTVIVGAIAIGGIRPAWHKLKSAWDYDNQLQRAQKIADKDNNGLSKDERILMYKEMGLPTINDELSIVKIPYEKLLQYNNNHGE
ncbi:hypothetical protein HY643_05135 [Candidatus Woesearchaeota archaeon]|nr:hypothetical protein [Candidatus Woesearchaeota archaeon]